jgi:hypothetical protein
LTSIGIGLLWGAERGNLLAFGREKNVGGKQERSALRTAKTRLRVEPERDTAAGATRFGGELV